jgi:hypothetical protein
MEPVRRAQTACAYRALVLDRAGGDTSSHVALRQDQQQGSRNRGDHSGGHDRVLFLVVVADVAIDPHSDRLQLAASVQGGGEDEVRPCPQESKQ